MTKTTYTPAGPWSNGNPPGISAAVMTAIESFLQSGWFDSQITSDGAGGQTVVKINLTLGSLTRIASFSASVSTSTTTVNHNLGVVPDIVILQPTGGVSTTRTVCYDTSTLTSTQVSLTANSSFNCVGLAIKF